MIRRARRRRLAVAAVVVVLAGTACSDDDRADRTTSSTTNTTEAPAGDGLEARLLTVDDLPDGFAPSADVDDTITAFCAGQDATAGLSASERAIVGFTRDPAGASVIEVAFRFDGEGAATFVQQSEALLTSCSDVPDASGLAFTYEPVSDVVAAAIGGVDASASRYGTSVGSGNLTVQVAVVQVGDVGALVAVLGLDQPRADLDELAVAAFEAAVAALRSPSVD